MQRPRQSRRSGFTLVEMVLAIAFTAILMTTISISLAEAESKCVESERLIHAVSLAAAKMTQLRSGQELVETDTERKFDQNAGVYRGYGYHIIIRSEKIDLAKVQQTGKLEGMPAIQDRLPAGVQNQPLKEKAGSSEASATGGIVEVYRAIVSITYPRGMNGKPGQYEIQTYLEKK